MKDKERIKGIIEAILFTMGESVAISRLSEVLDILISLNLRTYLVRPI